MAYTWSFSPIADFPLIPTFEFDKQGSVVAYPVNAVGDGVTDDTMAIKQMFASGAKVFDLLGKWYKINIPEGTCLASFVGVAGIRIYGRGGGFIDSRTYTADSITSIISLDACVDVQLEFNYKGQAIPDLIADIRYQGIGYVGATVVWCKNGCNSVKVYGTWEHARYGVRSGDYADHLQGGSSNIATKLDCYGVGYPVAYYLTNDVSFDIRADKVHRSVYLAGVVGATGHVICKNQYIAPIQVLLTDAKCGDGVSRGCQNIDISVTDSGTTRVQEYTWLAGISPSRSDPNTVYSDIHIDVHVHATDTTARNVGGFLLNSSVNSVLPAYQNWNSTTKIRDISVSGVVDRSKMANMSYNVFDLYVIAQESDSVVGVYPSISRLDFVDFRVITGSGGNPRPLKLIIPGLADRVNFHNSDTTTFQCDFVVAGSKAINYSLTPPVNTGSWHP